LIVTSAVVDQQRPTTRASVAAGARSVSDARDREYVSPSDWFG